MICTFSNEIRANGEHLKYINYFNDLILFHQELLVFLDDVYIIIRKNYLSNFWALFCRLESWCFWLFWKKFNSFEKFFDFSWIIYSKFYIETITFTLHTNFYAKTIWKHHWNQKSDQKILRFWSCKMNFIWCKKMRNFLISLTKLSLKIYNDQNLDHNAGQNFMRNKSRLKRLKWPARSEKHILNSLSRF